MRARPSKYGNRRTEVDGISFASKAEAKRYGELKLLERAGEISALRLQPSFPIKINDTHCFTYVGDFQYRARDGRTVIEDSKGAITALFKLKKKCVEAYYGIEIEIVRS